MPRITIAPSPEELILSGWAFVRSDRNEVHVAGCDEMGHVGHVSPSLAAYDRALKAAVVPTGSTYLLVGHPGLGPNAQRLLGRRLSAWDDVTELVATYGLGAALHENGCCET